MATIEHLTAGEAKVASERLAPVVEELRARRGARSNDVDVVIDGVATSVPDQVRDALVDVLEQFAKGKAVMIAPIDQLLTTTQTADLLGVSRQYVCRLVDQGVLPVEFRGTHRRIALGDVMSYRDAKSKVRGAALDTMAEIARTEGLYEDDF